VACYVALQSEEIPSKALVVRFVACCARGRVVLYRSRLFEIILYAALGFVVRVSVLGAS
jgi:hypothetical protein